MRPNELPYRMFTEAFLIIRGKSLADSIGAHEADGVTAYGYVDPADGIRFYCFAGADPANKKMLEATSDPRIVSYNSVRYNEISLYFEYTEEQKKAMKDAEAFITAKIGHDPEKAALRHLGWLDCIRDEMHPDRLHVTDSEGNVLHLEGISADGKTVRTKDLRNGGTVKLVRMPNGRPKVLEKGK